MNILYLVFGRRLNDHVQANLSIRSFMRQLTDNDTIYVITTNPEYYSRIDTVRTITVSEDTLREWKGRHGFFWRVKIKAIEHIVKLCPDEHLLYIDSDTVLTGNLEQIRTLLDNGCGMMHLNEGHPGRMKSKSLKMWKKVAGHTYGGITLGRQHDMWNAGVVAIPRDKLRETVALTLRICDGMLEDDVERVVIEQYSLSIALYETTVLKPAEDYITHYWGNKGEFNDFAHEFFLKSYMAGRNVEDEVAQLDMEKLMSMPVRIKMSNINRLLTNLINNMFTNKIQTP